MFNIKKKKKNFYLNYLHVLERLQTRCDLPNCSTKQPRIRCWHLTKLFFCKDSSREEDTPIMGRNSIFLALCLLAKRELLVEVVMVVAMKIIRAKPATTVLKSELAAQVRCSEQAIDPLLCERAPGIGTL